MTLIPLLAAQSLRYLRRHAAQSTLAVIGIALGVAVVVAIHLAQASARRAFEQAVNAVTGRATHQIVGGPSGVDESLYIRLRLQNGFRDIAPVIETSVVTDSEPRLTLRWLGVDPLAEPPFRGYTERRAYGEDLRALMTEPGAALLSTAAAARLHVRPGDALPVRHAGARHTLHVAGLLDGQRGPQPAAATDLIVTDVATAQELLGMAGRLSRIDAILERDDDMARLRRLLPADAELVSAAAHSRAAADMTRAFNTHLDALSLLALLVGLFLIYNTETFLVVQRRELIGILRALGVTRREVIGVILLEALCLGAIGTALGIAAGMALGNGLTALVARTVSDLYYDVTVRELAVPPSALLQGALLGLAGTVLAALRPALEAAGAPPRMALNRCDIELTTATRARRLVWPGITAALAGVVILLLPQGGMNAGFAGLFLLLLGGAAITPAATAAILRGVERTLLRTGGVYGMLATRSLAGAVSRTGVASAALTIAVATTIGIGLMIASFRGAVDDWLQHLLRADLYLSTTDGGQRAAPLPRDLAARIAALPQVAAISTVRRTRIDTAGGVTELVAYRFAPKSYAGFRFRAGGGERTWRAFEEEDAVLVSEPYAYRHGVVVGTPLRLRTDIGVHAFTVTGIYVDYASDRGTVAMSRRTYDRYYRDRDITGVGVYGRDHINLAEMESAVREAASAWTRVDVVPNRALRESSLAVFDQTFAITGVLRIIAGLIALLGVLNALMALQLERAFEYAVLRAVGLTPRQLAAISVGQTGILGAIAGLIAMPIGAAMAAVLVYVINRRSFGWSMDLQLSPAILAEGLLLAVTAAVLAGVYPAAASARARPADALRAE